MKFQYIRFILPKVELIFPQSLLHYQHTLSTFVRDAVYWSCKTVWWSVRALQCAVLQLIISKMARWGRTDSKYRFLPVKSWLVSCGTVKESF